MIDFSALHRISSSASVYCRNEAVDLMKINVFLCDDIQHINMLMYAINCVFCAVTLQVNAGSSAYFHPMYGSG